MTTDTSSVSALADRLVHATNRHDLAALVGCFAPDFVNETPAHPARSFSGSDQVRRTWSEIFASVPDLRADVLRRVVDGDSVWIEWEMQGSRVDGSRHVMRGVTIFGAKQGRFAWVRFYLEPVDVGSAGIEEAVREHLGL